MKEAAKRSGAGLQDNLYICPECGKPFENVSTSERHKDGTYEVHLMAWHVKPNVEADRKVLVAPLV